MIGASFPFWESPDRGKGEINEQQSIKFSNTITTI